MTIFGVKMTMKSGLEFFILKLNKTLQSCWCQVQKDRPRKAGRPGRLAGKSEGAHSDLQNKKFYHF
jgi:hypothetical protein